MELQTVLPEPLAAPELVAVALGFMRAHDGWRHQIDFDPDNRFSLLLYVDDSVDVWLCTWLPGQTTGLHDHGGSAGAVAVVSGRLSERRLARGGRVSHRTIRTGRSTSFTPAVVHDVGNRRKEPAVSLHTYSPPLSRMSFYERDGRTPLTPTRTIDLMAATTWDSFR
jgi:predicted metal-dependent enzyme (double-stranded beta helix superfamily)